MVPRRSLQSPRNAKDHGSVGKQKSCRAAAAWGTQGWQGCQLLQLVLFWKDLLGIVVGFRCQDWRKLIPSPMFIQKFRVYMPSSLRKSVSTCFCLPLAVGKYVTQDGGIEAFMPNPFLQCVQEMFFGQVENGIFNPPSSLNLRKLMMMGLTIRGQHDGSSDNPAYVFCCHWASPKSSYRTLVLKSEREVSSFRSVQCQSVWIKGEI